MADFKSCECLSLGPVCGSVISVVGVMSAMRTPDRVHVPGVVRVVVRDEVCRGVCRVRLVLSVLLLRYG
jgi:hypothetical protein